MFGIGFILGPVIGGLLGGIDLRLPFFVAGALALVNWLLRLLRAARVAAAGQAPAVRVAARQPGGVAARAWRALKGVGPLVSVMALASLAQFMLHTTWVLYTTFKFGWGPARERLVAVRRRRDVGAGAGRAAQAAAEALLAAAAGGGRPGCRRRCAYLGCGPGHRGLDDVRGDRRSTLLGGAAPAAMQSLVSNAADPTTPGPDAWARWRR